MFRYPKIFNEFDIEKRFANDIGNISCANWVKQRRKEKRGIAKENKRKQPSGEKPSGDSLQSNKELITSNHNDEVEAMEAQVREVEAKEKMAFLHRRSQINSLRTNVC